MPLKTLGNVRSELARLYRGALNRRVPAEELSRLVFCLRELRCCLEAMETAEARNEIIDVVAAPPLHLNLYAVPRGAQIGSDEVIRYAALRLNVNQML